MLKKTWIKLYSILFFALTIFVAVASLKADNPPAVVTVNSPDTIFSAKRAYKHLLQIARAPHAVGTREHELVKNYIVTACQQMGLDTRIQNSTELDTKGNTLVAVGVNNIIAKIKGTKPRKSVLITAHYDSQPNTPGGADDGMGVVAMLETARAIKASPAMPHDVILVFTDGEEQGLFGAKALLKDSVFENVGFEMNWDFRGNKGTILTYETNSHNGWLIRQYAKGTKYPIGNSMGYEISKRMPNSVDFRYFRKAGVTGFTNGLVEGYSSYHSMTDKPENLDLRSLQQAGDNMLSMAKYVANMPPLGNTKTPDLSYFNVFGYWFVYYPSSLNLYLIVAVTLIFVLIMITGIRNGKIKPAGFIAGAVALPVCMAISYFVSLFLLKRIIKHYPLYTHFYGNNSYNSEWYFLSMTMLSLFIFSIVFQFISRKWEYFSTFAGILLICMLCMCAVYIYAPSASWLLLIPLLFLTGGYGWMTRKKENILQKTTGYYLINFIATLPAVMLFVPLVYFMFNSFGLSSAMPFVCIVIALISALSYPVLNSVFKNYRWLVPVLSIIGVFTSLVYAHLNSGFNQKHPLQSNIRYRVNTTDSSAVWLSNDMVTDKFTRIFFPDKKIDTTTKNTRTLIHSAPVISYAPPAAIIQHDTTYQNKREVTLLCKSARNNVNAIGIVINDSTLQSILNVEINNSEVVKETNNNTTNFNNIIFYGPPAQGILVKFTLKANAKLSIKVFDRSMGLPLIKGLTEFPQDVIPSPGFTSNITCVEQNFLL